MTFGKIYTAVETQTTHTADRTPVVLNKIEWLSS